MLRISSKMLQKHKVALSQQLVLKRVLLTSVTGGDTKIAGKLATGKSLVAAIQLRLQHQIED